MTKNVSETTKKTNEGPKELISIKVPTGAYYGTGKRKTSIARVWVFPGTGRQEINGETLASYLKRAVLCHQVLSALKKLGMDPKYDVKITVKGGGLTGQAQAARLGVARALVSMDENFKSKLREDGLLTRDARIKERKKYGKKRARKGYQFRKR